MMLMRSPLTISHNSSRRWIRGKKRCARRWRTIVAKKPELAEANEKLERSARNLPNVAVLRVAGLNVYDVLRHPKLLLTEGAVAAIERRLGTDRGRGGAGAGEAAS